MVRKGKEHATAAAKFVFEPSKKTQAADNWGTAGTVAGAMSMGLLTVGLCFTPMSCLAVPVSLGGFVAALFSTNAKLRKIGIIANGIVLVLSLLIVLWMGLRLANIGNDLDRHRF
ncbi:MAG: hypothetical protein JNL18_10405 [Planctomycetaceae bacterium]|nr:hypothetical protein [Lacipirellula limnantheis]MBL9163135.1 hypothetical protein [Planctomycetaceae bacterium]